MADEAEPTTGMMRVPVSRRRFFVRGTQLLSAAIGLMLSIPAIGFLLSPLFSKKTSAWVRVGAIDKVPLGIPTAFTVDVPLDQGPPVAPVSRVVYVVRPDEKTTLILSNTCSHMQCNVHWEQDLKQFLCPCHGGLYDLRGRNVGGPPPSPLPKWVSRVTRDAHGANILEIQNRYEDNV